MKIKGLDLDSAGRCRHYHTSCDVVALKCATCQHYYACYHCHDSLENHRFQASDVSDCKPILCGNCMTYLDFIGYQTDSCPNCHHPFNPDCKAHYSIYFKGV